MFSGNVKCYVFLSACFGLCIFFLWLRCVVLLVWLQFFSLLVCVISYFLIFSLHFSKFFLTFSSVLKKFVAYDIHYVLFNKVLNVSIFSTIFFYGIFTLLFYKQRQIRLRLFEDIFMISSTTKNLIWLIRRLLNTLSGRCNRQNPDNRVQIKHHPGQLGFLLKSVYLLHFIQVFFPFIRKTQFKYHSQR